MITRAELTNVAMGEVVNEQALRDEIRGDRARINEEVDYIACLETKLLVAKKLLEKIRRSSESLLTMLDNRVIFEDDEITEESNNRYDFIQKYQELGVKSIHEESERHIGLSVGDDWSLRINQPPEEVANGADNDVNEGAIENNEVGLVHDHGEDVEDNVAAHLMAVSDDED
jgi:hypothetical protein